VSARISLGVLIVLTSSILAACAANSFGAGKEVVGNPLGNPLCVAAKHVFGRCLGYYSPVNGNVILHMAVPDDFFGYLAEVPENEVVDVLRRFLPDADAATMESFAKLVITTALDDSEVVTELQCSTPEECRGWGSSAGEPKPRFKIAVLPFNLDSDSSSIIILLCEIDETGHSGPIYHLMFLESGEESTVWQVTNYKRIWTAF